MTNLESEQIGTNNEPINFYKELKISPDNLTSLICNALSSLNPMQVSYIANQIVDEVAEDIYWSADKIHWNDSDVKLSVIRVIEGLCYKV